MTEIYPRASNCGQNETIDEHDLHIQVLYGNMPADQQYVHDIYDNLDDAIRDHSDELIVVGYCILTKDNKPLGEDWYETYEDAMRDVRRLTLGHTSE